LFRISCHSSVVKVQRPGRDGDRRRTPMMRHCDRGVKPADPSTEPHRLGTTPPRLGRRLRMLGAARQPCQTIHRSADEPAMVRSGSTPAGAHRRLRKAS
jgi:hypothetical protein